VKRTPVQNSAIQTVAQKYSPNDVSIILFTDEKTFTVTPKSPQNDRLPTYPSTKKKDVMTKRLRSAYTINVQSLVASLGESQVVDTAPV